MKSILWFLVGVSLSLHLRGQENWTCYTDKQELLMDNQLVLGVFNYVDGSVWFVTNKGINIFKDGEWKTINKKTELLKNKIGSYMVDSQNRIWVGTGAPDVFFDGYALGQLYSGGVVVYDGNEWKPMNTKDMGIKSPVVTQMIEAANGDIWLGVSSVTPGAEKGGLFAKGALLRLSKETGEWTDYRQKDMPCLDCHFVKSFYEDENGKLFFIASNGIYYFEDGEFHSVVKDNREFDFRSTWITARFVDSQNNLWLGAPARVAKYDQKNWTSFNRKNGLPPMDNPPRGFLETPEHTIIMSTTKGLYTFNGADHWEQEKIKYLYGNSHLDDQGRLWIPIHNGLLIRDGDQETLDKELPKVWRILKDKHGGTWVFSRGKGVKRYKDGKWKLFDDKNQLPSNSFTLTHVDDNGVVWLGTNKGICSCSYE